MLPVPGTSAKADAGKPLGGLSDSEDGGAADGALALGSGPAILKLDLLGVVDVSVVSAL